MKTPELWIMLFRNGKAVVPVIIADEEEAETRARAGQEVWRVMGLERVRPPQDTASGCGCACRECIAAGLSMHRVCVHRCALQTRDAMPKRSTDT
jgi:hypothetical protein